jgi:phage gp29-like protein
MEINENDCRWMVFKLLDNERPWMSGAIRKVAFPFLTKQYAYADWRNNSVIYGNPIRKLTTTMEAAGQIDVFSFVRDLAERIRKGAPVVLPTGFDLNQMEATQHSPEMFKLLIDKCDVDIAISILGQNLTTEVQSGSYSAANIHKDIMLQYIQADISLLNKIVYEQLVKEFYEFNFGDNVQIPRPHWNATPPEDIESLNKAAIDKMSVVKSFLDINPEYKGNIAFETLARELRIPLNDKLMNN